MHADNFLKWYNQVKKNGQDDILRAILRYYTQYENTEI